MTDPVYVTTALDGIPRPDFAEMAIVALPTGAPVDPLVWAREIFSVRRAPLWVRLALGLRQLLAPLVGVPRATADVFRVDDVIGEEALIITRDAHLDFHVAVGVDVAARLVRVTTAVTVHGRRGRLYLAVVRVVHSPVLHAMLRAAAGRMAWSPRTP